MENAVSHELKRGIVALIADIFILLVLGIPGFVWVGNLSARVDKLEQERIEMRQDLRAIITKIDDVRDQMKGTK